MPVCCACVPVVWRLDLQGQQALTVLLWAQGAAVAAALLAEQQANLAQQKHPCCPPLRFAVLCSGYVSPAAQHRRLHAQRSPIMLPSLHVYSIEQEQDRQIGVCESRELRDLFDAGSRQTIEHSAGHIIPARRPVCLRICEFLRTFLEVQ